MPDADTAQNQSTNVVPDDTPAALIDAAGSIVAANDLLADLTGCLATDLHGRSVVNLIHHHDIEIGRAFVQSARRGNSTSAIEVRLFTAGGPVLARWTLSDAGAEDGDSRFVLHVESVAERQAVDDALAARESRKTAIFESMHEGLVVVSVDGEIVEWNPAAERILGLTASEMASRSLADERWDCVRENGVAWPADQHPSVVALATGEPVSDQMMGIRHADGSVSWVVCSAAPMFDSLGTVTGVCVSIADITARTVADDKLRWQAFHDSLTGLANRALLLSRLDNALRRSLRTDDCVAVFFLDLDRFKLINDTLGHDVGDELLYEVAVRLDGVIRGSDTVARLGGDEFVVAVDCISDTDEVEVIARRIQAVFDAPFTVGGRSLVIRSSIGVAVAKGHDAESLIRDADTALYRAKDRGRNRFEVFDESLRLEAIRKLTTEEILRAALEGDGIVAFYQPVVDLVTGAIVSCEALLRIPGPGGLQSPGDFIQIAEETGLIVPIGAGVLDDACRQLAGWRRQLGLAAPAHVSVNVSARQLEQEGFSALVERTLASHGLAPHDLILEFTESVIVEADRQTSDNITRLHEAGVSLAVDDFGTGYSSLSYLKRFPVNIVKLDRSFVDGLLSESEDLEIVKAVLALGRALGLSVTAEGIETPEQLDALRALGCDHGQGYLLGRPVNPQDTITALDEAKWATEFRRPFTLRL